MQVHLPRDWRAALHDEMAKQSFQDLSEFVDRERKAHTVYPPEADVFAAFAHTPLGAVKVVLLGQDPYPGPGQAHGLCFSVRPGVKPPASLMNMFKELKTDVGCTIPNNGCLTPWADQGMLLLNAVLTVRAGEPNSHKNHGWEKFTDAAIRAVNDKKEPVVFALWGAYAQKKEKLVDTSRHRVLKAAHPSPLSAQKFFGSKPFSAINKALVELGHTPIEWQLPSVP
jgi:uracil-DNA glycosylase